MFKFFEKHPFITGVIVGTFGVRKIFKAFGKLFKSKITIIRIDIPNEKNMKDPRGENQPEATKEN